MGHNRSTGGRTELADMHQEGQMGSEMMEHIFILIGKKSQPEPLATSIGYSSLTCHKRIMKRLSPKQQRPLRPALVLLPLLSDCLYSAWKVREGFLEEVMPVARMNRS